MMDIGRVGLWAFLDMLPARAAHLTEVAGHFVWSGKRRHRPEQGTPAEGVGLEAWLDRG